MTVHPYTLFVLPKSSDLTIIFLPGLLEDYFEVKSLAPSLPPSLTYEHSRMTKNVGKNRYSDVQCFDHTRVKLLNWESDYIHANYCDGYMQKRAFISTQGPTERTRCDFWHMVWQESVVVIVMTTKVVENQKIKCDQYWPLERGSVMSIGKNFKLTNNEVTNTKSADYKISHLTLTNLWVCF